MVSFTLTAGFAMLAAMVSAAAVPGSPFPPYQLEKRQEQLPANCTEYCNGAAGCVCLRRPTNCVANYLVDNGDTCGSVVDRFQNFTASELYKWNPEIGKECFGLRAFTPICVSVTGYKFQGPVKGGDIWTAQQIPVPVQPQVTSNCTKFQFTDMTGHPTLATILTDNGLSKQQWNNMNVPNKDPEKDWAVWAGYFSCVKV